MKNKIQILNILFLWLISFSANSQSITLLSDNYLTYCAGSTIEIPVSLSGTWNSNNTFRLKLTNTYRETRRADTTFYVQAINNHSPLRFQLPSLYNNDGYYSQNQYFTITIQSSNPVVNSNSQTIILNKLPSIKLLYPTDNTVGIPFNEYKNPDVSKMIKSILATGSDDNSCRFKLSDSSTTGGGIFIVNPLTTTTYSVVKIWNSCGVGRILGNNSVTVKVNPFRIKNTSVIPNEICENKRIRIKFDYEGRFNNTNTFFVDLCNITGDTVRALNAVREDSSNVYADIPSNISPGIYGVRVRGTAPDIATAYAEIKVQPKPTIEIGGFANQQPYPDNYPLQVRANFYGGTITPILVRFSNGVVGKNWGSYSGGTAETGYISDVTLNLKANKYYTIDSVITTCGVLTNYTVIGARSFNIIDDFYIQPLPKSVYCEGEKIKFKIKSNYVFSQNNVFTLNIYSANVLVTSVPVSVIGDSLEATLPTSSQLSIYGYDNFNLTISSSSPQKTTPNTWDYFSIKRKPDFTLANATSTLTTPGFLYINGNVSGNSSFSFIVNDGINNVKNGWYSQIYENESYISPRGGYVRVAVGKSKTFYIRSISNSCGTKNFTTPLTHSVTISNPYSKYIYFTNSESLQSISRDRNSVAEFDTIGYFQPNEEFVLILTYNNISYEIGRGRQSPIAINFPANFPPITGNNITGTIFLQSASQPNVQSLQFQTNIYHKILGSFEGASIHPNLSIPTTKTPKKTVNVLKDDVLTTYLYTNLINTNEYKINGKWFTKSSRDHENYFLIQTKITKDTTLILEGIKDFRNELVVNDTIIIRIKKFRINSSAIGLDLCQGDQIEVFFGVEGDKSDNPPQDYKMFIQYQNSFYQNTDTAKRELPIIAKKAGSYIVKIPEFPYAGTWYFIKIVPTDGSDNDFAEYTRRPNVRISRKINVGLTAMDGTNTVWFDGTSTGVSIKAVPIGVNVQETSWSGQIVEIAGNQQVGVSSTYPNQFVNAVPSVFKINNVQNQCGYGGGIGTVELKKCFRDLYIFNYNSPMDRENFSSNFISIFGISPYVLSANKSYIFSAKNFTQLYTGFEIKGNSVQSFDIDTKGCVVTPR